MILNAETDEYTENPLFPGQGIVLDIHSPDISSRLLNEEPGTTLNTGSSTSIKLKLVSSMTV